MLGGGIMVNFVSYESLKPNVNIDEYPELKMDEIKYPFMSKPIIIESKKEESKKDEPKK